MAYLGLKRPVIAQRKDDGTYEKGFTFAKAVELNITPEFAEAFCYGDDSVAESAREFSRATITLGVTTIPIDAFQTMFGHTVLKTATDGAEITYKTDDSSNYVGFGIYSNELVDGVKKFVAMWIPKVQFSETQESYTTKGDSIEFQTPSIEGTAMGTDERTWQERKIFEDETKAIAWLNTKAGITTSKASTTTTSTSTK